MNPHQYEWINFIPGCQVLTHISRALLIPLAFNPCGYCTDTQSLSVHTKTFTFSPSSITAQLKSLSTRLHIANHFRTCCVSRLIQHHGTPVYIQQQLINMMAIRRSNRVWMNYRYAASNWLKMRAKVVLGRITETIMFKSCEAYRLEVP